jgi:hypothetical protein
MSHFSLPLLRRAAANLEIPDCDQKQCPDHFRLLCVHAGEEDQPCASGHECDCPRTPGQPCSHIRARHHDMPFDQWAALLARAYRGEEDDYDEPPRPGSPATALSRQARVAVYAERFWRGLGLFHDGDSWSRLAELLKIGLVSTRPEDDFVGPPRPRWVGASFRPSRLKAESDDDGSLPLELILEDGVGDDDWYEDVPAEQPRRLRNGRPNPIEGLRRAA